MPSVTLAQTVGFLKLAEPLFCAVLKELLEVPAQGAVDWVKKRFTDHSTALPKAIATANERAWQAVSLALAGDSLFEKIFGRFRDGDLKAVRDQIKAFVANAETGFEGTSDGLRAKACAELVRLRAEGKLGLDGIVLTSIDLNRFASPSKTSDDAHWAVAHLANALHTDAPHLSQVLTLTPPGGGTPLLAAAFAFFLRRQIATNEELSRELTHDSLRWLTLKQQAGFGNLEQLLAEQGEALRQQMTGFFADNFAKLSDIEAKLDQLIEQHQVSKKAESPLRISVTSEAELNRLKQLRDRLREVPLELVEAKLHSLLGDGLAAAGQFAEAQQEHASAATVAHDAQDANAEAEAAYKQFKDACELKQWEPALEALQQAISLDEKRFRPVPKHYAIDAILGAGAFGVVFKCRNTISFDEDDNELVLAVKTFRETDLDRELKLIFSEANTLKNLTHTNIIRVLDHGYAETDTQQRPFLAMEYFDGITLEDHLANHGKLSLPDFYAVFSQIAAALHKAHTGKRQIIHRDLKPANIMIRKVGETWIVKVIDFGLAVKSTIRSASISVPHALRVTRDKSITGTIKYAAPEQLGDRAYPVGPHSDVFAFGKTGLEALFATVQPTPKHWKLLSDSLSELLARCVDEEFNADNPDDGRFHNFEPILRELKQLSKPVPVDQSPTPEQREAERIQAEERLFEAQQAERLLLQSEQLQRLAEEPERVRRLEAEQARIRQEREEADRIAYESNCVANFDRWSKTQEPRAWVEKHLYDWNDATWKELIRRLKQSQFWPLIEENLARHLEGLRDRILIEHRQRDEQRKAGEVDQILLPGGVKIAFAWCPSGKFQMGSNNGSSDEKPVHEVLLTKGYWIGSTPVTQAQCRAIMGNNPSKFKGPQLPVEKVSWTDAVQFCQRLSDLPEQKKAGWRYRLPTEAEWEYACRAGTTTDYCSGNGEAALRQVGWFDGNAGGSTKPVGELAANAWGLYDMHGNVWEWCADWYSDKYYAQSPKDDPQGPSSGSERVVRGGSWGNSAVNCRAAYRPGYRPSGSSSHLGFRVVRVSSDGTLLPSSDPAASPATVKPLVAAAPIIQPVARKISLKPGHLQDLTLPGGVKMAFVWCPPGTFMMGSNNGSSDEKPVHEVRLTKGCWMGVTPVTQAQWQAIMGNNPSDFKGPQIPVEQVSWDEAVQFCRSVQQKCGIELRLPTEAEWEYACRAGTTTDYCSGNGEAALRQVGWFDGNAGGSTKPVGELAANAWGLYDMHGNVWEWCADWYSDKYYAQSPKDDPQGPSSGSERVRRGGSWRSTADYCRSAYRDRYIPDYRRSGLGFRVVRVPSGRE